jgi:colanic acid biosynthesis glycosyl transferase WcaI
MKILIVSQYFWPESFRINAMALALIERGYEVSVLTGLPNYPKGKIFPGYRGFFPRKEIYQKITIHRVPLFPRGNASSWQLCLNYLSFMLCASVFSPFLCRGKYDIIFCFQPSPVTVGIPAVVLKKIKKAPLFFWVQDSWPETLTAVGRVKSGWILKCVQWLVKWIYQRCDKILTPAKALIPMIASYGIVQDKIVYFPNWAENFYKPLSQSLVDFPDGFVIVFAGNHGEAQALDSVIQAAYFVKQAGVHDIHWVLIGEGHRKSFLQAKVREMALESHVHFMEGKPAQEMPYYFSAADALLITLLDRAIFSMTIPSKLQSYMACAKPILAAVAGETVEIITRAAAGFSCPPEQARALADIAIQLYQLTDEQRKEMAKNAYDYYQKHFVQERLLTDLIKQLDEATI